MTLPPRRFIERSEGEEYLHREVWHIALRQLEHAKATPKGNLRDDLAAMVFASHALEGYLNFLGELVAPELWKDERKGVSRKGLAGKLDVLHGLCGLAPIDTAQHPYSSILRLKELRNLIAHPKIYRTEGTVEYGEEDDDPPLFQPSYLEGLVSHQRAIEALADVKLVVDYLHAAAVVRFSAINVGPAGLEGVMSQRSTSVTVKESEVQDTCL